MFSQDEAGGSGRGGKDDDTRKSADGVIKPSLEPDPNRKPEGKPTEKEPNLDESKKHDIDAENHAAKLLAEYGYGVKQNPSRTEIPANIDSKKYPDYLVEGVPMDCYTPQADTSERNIWITIKDKVEGRQTDGVVLNLDNLSKEKVDGLIAYLQTGDIDIKGIRSIIAVREGEIIVIYPK
ncbi:tRNA nuclease CdiA-2 [Anaerolineae bacterium]|nr:tRNA nuclease CdiA-2 [Anaerolineae bacterium]